jgi:hypothetical protein
MTPDIKLAFQDKALECYKDEQLIWRTPAASILLIAEYTTNNGPRFDDYFLELWSLEKGSLLCSKTPFYAAGIEAAFMALSRQLKADLEFGLTHSTEWASRIIWPPHLAGHSYFSFREITPNSWQAKLSRYVFGAKQEYFRTEEVQAFLKHKRMNSETNQVSE